MGFISVSKSSNNLLRTKTAPMAFCLPFCLPVTHSCPQPTCSHPFLSSLLDFPLLSASCLLVCQYFSLTFFQDPHLFFSLTVPYLNACLTFHLLISVTSTPPALLGLSFLSAVCVPLNELYTDAINDYNRSMCSYGSKYQTFYMILLGSS